MTAYTGTIAQYGRLGEIGRQTIASGYYTLGAEIEDTDTITWDNVMPNGKFKVIDFEVWGVELDTNATPTATFTIGDETDPDGYLTTKGGAITLSNSLAGQLFYKGDGALLNTTTAGRDVVLTMTAATATGASSGKIWWKAVIEGIG